MPMHLQALHIILSQLWKPMFIWDNAKKNQGHLRQQGSRSSTRHVFTVRYALCSTCKMNGRCLGVARIFQGRSKLLERDWVLVKTFVIIILSETVMHNTYQTFRHPRGIVIRYHNNSHIESTASSNQFITKSRVQKTTIVHTYLLVAP